MAIDLTNLLNKKNNPDNTALEDYGADYVLTSEEWIKTVTAIQENQNSIKKINYNNVDFLPDANGTVTILVADTGITTAIDTFSNQTYIVTTDGTVKLQLRFTSIQTADGVTFKNTFEQGIVTVYHRTNSGEDWKQRGSTIKIASVDYANNEAYVEVDITDYLDNGSQQIRLSVTGENSVVYAGELIFNNIVKTTIGLTFANQWFVPMVGETLPLYFYYSGAVAKTLHIQIDRKEVLTPSIGGVMTETAQQFNITNKYEDGVHELKAWISVDNSDIETEPLIYQLLFLKDANTKVPYIWISEAVTEANNWEQTVFFKYATYNFDTATFKIQNYSGSVDYLTYTQTGLVSNKEYSFANTLEVDSEDEAFGAYVRVYNGAGVLVDQSVAFQIDNRNNFNPTSGADFILNPKLRDNNEANPNTIINAATGEIVGATFSSNFGFVTDGWVEENNLKRLRVPAGKNLTINYEPFSQFIGSSTKTNSLTIEMDFEVKNVYDENSPIIKMCSYLGVDGLPLGLEFTPYQSCFLTSNNRVKGDQDIMYQDETRTHVALNIVYNLSASGLNYVRFFVNGIINREFTYRSDDVFVQNGTSGGIQIGSNGADVDIYGIRIYKKALSASDIRQDYLSSLATSSEKIAFRNANDILDDNNQISYNKVFNKLNTLLWYGCKEASLDENNGGKGGTGNLIINIVGDPAHSGTLYNVSQKGQGTSSKKYWKWNIQYGFTKKSLEGEHTDADSLVASGASYWEDGNGKKNFKAKYNKDSNKTEFSSYYVLQDGEQKATKLVAKRNWASSMQSHKIGATALYTDLWRIVCNGSGITAQSGKETCRVSVLEKPFMYFVQENADTDPVFMGFMTFGAGKGDKATFGIDDSNSLMIEGSKNYAPIFERRVPWIKGEDNSGEETWYCDDESNDELNECYVYNGEAVADFDMGTRDYIDYFVDAFNFTYLHTNHIEPYEGTYEALQRDSQKLNQYTQYWITTGSNTAAKFDLFRYNPITETFVPAGITKDESGNYATLNINSQCGNVYSSSDVNYAEMNKYFKEWRVSDFKSKLSRYYVVNDALYHQAFCKMIGASDNRCKNTYEYLDPVTFKIRFFQDDLDTILATDNVGRKNKPYYVEEHDYNASGSPFWNSENNYFYDLLDAAYPAEQRSTMRSILAGMATLGGTISGCMEKYFFYVQKYFPAVAYNEAARILYEAASVRYNAGLYTNDTNPMTQSLGDQLQAELQWWKRREIYLSSYASYGEFNSPFINSLSFRSISNKAGNSNPSATFTLTPSMWLYPVESVDNSLQYGKDQNGNTATLPQRVKAGQAFQITANIGNDISNYIPGINYYTNVGSFTNIPVGQTFILNGDKLTEFIANGNEFRITGISNVTAKSIKKLDLSGTSTLSGNLNLILCNKLENLNLENTVLTRIYLPATETLTTVKLPASITILDLSNQRALSSISLQGASNLQEVICTNSNDTTCGFVLDQLYKNFGL